MIDSTVGEDGFEPSRAAEVRRDALRRAHIPGIIRVILSRGLFEELVVEGCSVGLVVVSGVVSLSDEDGVELEAGAEVGAGLADRFVAAVEQGGSFAVAVAEEPVVLGA